MATAINGAFAPAIAVIDGTPTTTSNEVAQHFGKDHAKILRDIRSLLVELPEEHKANFGEMFNEVQVGNGATRKDPAYRLTRDGFTLLAMGFTGKKALTFKLAYIDAFNRMEAELRGSVNIHAPANPAIDYTRISPAQAQDLKELVHRVVESGVQGFGETWRRLHNKFRVNSYLELPAARFDDARQYLLGKLPSAPLPQNTDMFLQKKTIDVLYELIVRHLQPLTGISGDEQASAIVAGFKQLTDHFKGIRETGQPVAPADYAKAVGMTVCHLLHWCTTNQQRLCAPVKADPSLMLVKRQHITDLWTDLGRLRQRIDSLGLLDSDLPPQWWQARRIGAIS